MTSLDTSSSQMASSIWGGFIDAILSTEGGAQKIRSDPELRSLYIRLWFIERTKSLREVYEMVKTIPFSEYELNRLCSPLLDHLRKVIKGTPPISSAVYYGYTETVKFLLDRGASVLTPYNTDLESASREGYIDIVRLLLQRGARMGVQGNIALRAASMNGHSDIVKLLLDHGADVHFDEERSLLWACRHGHNDTVEVLLDQGADIHNKNDDPLQETLWQRHFETAELLLRRGADFTIGMEAVKYWLATKHMGREHCDQMMKFLNEYIEKKLISPKFRESSSKNDINC